VIGFAAEIEREYLADAGIRLALPICAGQMAADLCERSVIFAKAGYPSVLNRAAINGEGGNDAHGSRN
jgi:hypothetical protein